MVCIRSQDKESLIDVNNIHYDGCIRKYSIFTNIDGMSMTLGKYSSEEKALKVMDMIEDTILKCEAMRTGYAEYDFGAFVFDMPADKDVEV